MRSSLQLTSRKLNNGPILTQKRLVYLELSTVSDFTTIDVPVAMYNHAKCLVQAVQIVQTLDTPERRKIFQLGKISSSMFKM